jgi:thiamine-phosphate pyrophosphorylase
MDGSKHVQAKFKTLQGLYLVVDPAAGLSCLLPKIKQALDGGVDIIQLWNHWPDIRAQIKMIHTICALAHSYHVPVIMNVHWERLLDTPLQGIHFDSIPTDWTTIKNTIGHAFITGLTCGNDFKTAVWAMENNIDYISFCSMFPSSTANSCELVNPEVIKRARQISDIPIFVSGGITPHNITSLQTLHINGIAVVSGILKANDPQEAAQNFKQSLYENNIQH